MSTPSQGLFRTYLELVDLRDSLRRIKKARQRAADAVDEHKRHLPPGGDPILIPFGGDPAFTEGDPNPHSPWDQNWAEEGIQGPGETTDPGGAGGI